jgi:hypothetical protein
MSTSGPAISEVQQQLLALTGPEHPLPLGKQQLIELLGKLMPSTSASLPALSGAGPDDKTAPMKRRSASPQ